MYILFCKRFLILINDYFSGGIKICNSTSVLKKMSIISIPAVCYDGELAGNGCE